MFGFGKKSKEIVVLAPVSGKVKELKSVKDEVFSKNLVGEGLAIVPKDGHVVSPIDGVAKVVFPTGHAYGIASKMGPEVLVHIGVDTVELNGHGFHPKVKKDAKLMAGSHIADFDLAIVNKKAKASDVIVLMTNESMTGYKIVEKAHGNIEKGQPLFKVVKG